MITGAGTPLADIISNAQAASSDARLSDSKLNKNNKNNLLSSTASSESNKEEGIQDTLELSDGAKLSLEKENTTLDLINQLEKKLSSSDVKLIEQRLEEINNQIDVLNELSSQSLTPEQEELINKTIKELGQKLNTIAGQLGLLGNSTDISSNDDETALNDDVAADNTQTETTEILNANFINAEPIENEVPGNSSEPIEADNTSLNLSLVTQLEAQTDLEDSFDNLLPKSDVVKNNVSSSALSDLVSQFTFSLQSFSQLVEEFSASLDDDNRIPPSMLKMIKNLLGSNEQNNTQQENIIDTVV